MKIGLLKIKEIVMPPPPFAIGDEVIHKASGQKAVVVEVDGDYVTVTYEFGKKCTCHIDALEHFNG